MSRNLRRGLAVVGMALASIACAPEIQGAVESVGTWQPRSLGMSVVSTLVFGLAGIVLAIVGFKLFDAVSPFNLEKEICEKQNLAVAVLCGAMILGICLIVAVAVL